MSFLQYGIGYAPSSPCGHLRLLADIALLKEFSVIGICSHIFLGYSYELPLILGRGQWVLLCR
jgi:hypothetical protein